MTVKALLKMATLLLLPFFTKAQSQGELDSLQMALKNAPDDTVKMVMLYNLGDYYRVSNLDSSLFYVERGITTATKINQPLWIARLLSLKGYVIGRAWNFSTAFKLCNQALDIIQDEKNEKNAYIPKDNEFAKAPGKYRLSLLINVYQNLGVTYANAENLEKALEYSKKGLRVSESLKSNLGLSENIALIGTIYFLMGKLDSSMIYSTKALKYANLSDGKTNVGQILYTIGIVYYRKNQLDSAREYYTKALSASKAQNNISTKIRIYFGFARLYEQQPDSAKYYATKALQLANILKLAQYTSTAELILSRAWKKKGNVDSAFAWLNKATNLSDSLMEDRAKKLTQFQNLNLEEQMRLEKIAQESIAAKNKIRMIALFIGLGLLSVLAFVFYRNNKQKQKANKVLEKTLNDLKSTQSQLIQSEKMASLGELTAGIAHEIQNPLNFVNNFSDVNKELLGEMKDEIDKGNIEEVKTIANDIIANEEKINHHGKRAGDIVKGMLQHSRSSTGVKEPTEINALADEYLRLCYQGLRAKDKSFNAELKTEFDASIGKINIIPQDIGRVLLNLYNNAFYAVDEKKKACQAEPVEAGETYEPTVSVTTKKSDNHVIITVSDNGNGIPEKVKDKIFQPFFTTKPTGQGTGLGLSLSYDIVKAHGGDIKVETREGEGSTFIIQLPVV